MSGDADVLLVDDDASIRETVALALESEGLRVRTAGHGEHALALLRSGLRPAVILLDLMMPRMSGWEFRRHQRADPQLAAIPVVIFSGAGEIGAHAEHLGAAGALGKPVTLDALLHTVRRFLPHRLQPSPEAP